MEIVYDDDALRGYIAARHRRSAPSTRCWSTGSSTTRSRSTSTRSTTAHELYLGGVMEHIEEAGIHSGDSSCALPPITLGERGDRPDPRGDRGDRPRRRRARAAQHPVRARLRRALRPRGQPARQPHGAVRLQGDRHPAGQGGRPGDARRVDRRSCGPRACCRPRATAATCRPTRRSRSRRR